MIYFIDVDKIPFLLEGFRSGPSQMILSCVDAIGAVVGWVGAGGTLGGVIFSMLFRELSYQKAFIAMGLSACGSAFLSLLMNIKSLNAIYEEKMRAEHIKTNNNLVFHDDAPIILRRPPRSRG